MTDKDQSAIPSFADVVKEAIRAALAMVHTAIPAVVESYDSALQTVTARPAIRFKHWDEDEEAFVFHDPPAIANVPVAWMVGGSGSLTMPLASGDHGMLVFCERSIDEWFTTGKDSNEPQDPRRHDLTDAWFYPGTRAKPDKLASEAFSSGSPVLRGNPVLLGDSTATDFVALSSVNDQNWTQLAAQFTAWTPVANDGGAALKALLTTLIAGGWPSDTSATKVKAK